MSEQRNVLTIATGKQVFLDLAINLARSFKWWNPGSEIQFYLVTDLATEIPADVKHFAIIKKIRPGDFGDGFSTKLYLDQLAPGGKTLFIDSDCLVFGDLKPLFAAFDGKPVSVIGSFIANGEWFGDIETICRNFEVPHLPKFNGGVYYLEKGKKATAVYETARKLEKEYDEIGFVRLRNKPNDEVLMALALQLNNQAPIYDDSTYLSDPQACPGGYSIDVLNGERWLINPPAPHPLHQSWYTFEKVSPLIVHFLGYYTTHYPYRRQAYRLQKALNNNLNRVTDFTGKLLIEYPGRLKIYLKNGLRPLYRKLFGFRKIKVSERV